MNEAKQKDGWDMLVDGTRVMLRKATVLWIVLVVAFLTLTVDFRCNIPGQQSGGYLRCWFQFKPSLVG